MTITRNPLYDGGILEYLSQEGKTITQDEDDDRTFYIKDDDTILVIEKRQYQDYHIENLYWPDFIEWVAHEYLETERRRKRETKQELLREIHCMVERINSTIDPKMDQAILDYIKRTAQ